MLWRIIAVSLGVVGEALIAAVAVLRREQLGAAQFALYGAALIMAGGIAVAVVHAALSPHARRTRRQRRRLADIAHARQELEEARSVESELRLGTEKLKDGEERLAVRLLTFHEWMEFPQPIEIQSSQDRDDRFAALADKDRELLKLLETETQAVFDAILQNKYVVDGQLQPLLMRDDAIELITKVAQLYQGDVENPLLETSIEKVLRSSSRVCLQLLVVLERLPLNVKQYNLNSMYRYVRQAVKAYGVYKSTEPYWPHISTAYYLGRFALGANPVSLSAWWFLSSLGKKHATEFTTRYVNRQVLNLLRDVVRVVGFETAAVYGGDFRHRDPNWIYGIELVELMRQVPLSPQSFSSALREIGALQLRSEYDRIFLYRCVAAGQSAQAERYSASSVLTGNDRHVIAQRLETFLNAFRLRGHDPALGKWSEAVESRLDVKLHTRGHKPQTQEEQRRAALFSLAGFLLEIKQREATELVELLQPSAVLTTAEESLRKQLLDQLAEQTPFFFEHPDIDAKSALADSYLKDLARLAVHVTPRMLDLDVVLANAAAFLRRPTTEMQRLLDEQSRTVIQQRFSGSVNRLPKLTPGVSRSFVDSAANR